MYANINKLVDGFATNKTAELSTYAIAEIENQNTNSSTINPQTGWDINLFLFIAIIPICFCGFSSVILYRKK